MSESIPKPNRRRRLITRAVLGVALLAAMVFAAWYPTSPQFHDWARRRLIADVEAITGGRVEIGTFNWNLRRLEFDVHDMTVHGLEGPDEIPYAHADRMLVHARILSLFRRDIALNYVAVEQPTIHLIFYPDGHTNQPKARVAVTNVNMQSLFELAIKHVDVRDGQLMVNDRKIPFDFTGDDLQAGMSYAAEKNEYDGDVKLTLEHARYTEYTLPSAKIDAAFRLLPKQLELTGFHLVSGASKLEASGKVVDFANPVVNFSYRATVDGTQIAKVLRDREISHGQIDMSGTAVYEKSALVSNGKLVARNVNYLTPGLRLSNIDAAADYRVDENTLSLTRVVGRVAGGMARGEVQVRWAAPDAKGASEQSGVARFRVENVPAQMAAAAFTTPQLQLFALNPVGTGAGTIDAHWQGSPAHAVLDLNLAVRPPQDAAPGQMTLAGELDGSYSLVSQQLQARSLDISLPMLHVSASGTLGLSQTRLHLSGEVTDLSRVKPVLAVVNQEGSAAGELAGMVKFEGELTGKLMTPAINGHVQVADFTFPLAAIWRPPPPLDIVSTSIPRQPQPKVIHIDSGSGDIEYSSQEVAVHGGVIRRAGAQARVDFSTGLEQGAFTDVSPVALRVSIQDAALADLQQIAGYNYPINGRVAANLDVHGTRLDLQGGGHVQVSNVVAYGEPIRSMKADVRFANESAEVENFVLLQDHGQVTGSGAYNLKQETLTFETVGTNFELGTIPALNRSHVSVSGRLSFTASGSGTLNAPLVNASAHLQNMVVNGERVGDARLLAVTKGETMHLTARSNFQTAEVTLDGSIRMREPFPATITMNLSNFDFMPFMQSVFQTKLSGQSYVGGKLVIDGPLRDPAALSVKAEIPKLTAQMEGVELHNTEPIRMSMTNQTVRIESLHLAGNDTQFAARGTVSLVSRRMDIRGNGRLNLKLVQSFNSDLNSGGVVDVNMAVTGTVSKPNLVGEVRIDNGSVTLIDFPNGLSSINGTLVFNEERIQVQTLTARTGGGDIRIGGFATYNPGVAFNVTVQGEDIRMRYPQGVSSTGNLNLKLVGTLNNSTLSGDVTVTRFAFNSQFDLASYLAKSIRPPEAPRVSPLNNVHFNVHVTSTQQLQVQSSLAKISGNADLRVRGTPANPILLGRVNVTEGQMDFNGARYRIDRGDISFLNPTRTEPTIDLAATTRVRDYDITLRFSGEPSHGLKTNYSSDPPLPAPDIINLLAFGQTREEAQIEATQGTSTMTETVSNAILGQAVNNAVSGRVQKLFGVSRVKISPEVGGAQTNPTAQVTIEQQVSNNITVTYISNLTQASQQSIFVEYYLQRNVSLIAGRDQYGVVSFDIRIRQRKR